MIRLVNKEKSTHSLQMNFAKYEINGENANEIGCGRVNIVIQQKYAVLLGDYEISRFISQYAGEII